MTAFHFNLRLKIDVCEMSNVFRSMCANKKYKTLQNSAQAKAAGSVRSFVSKQTEQTFLVFRSKKNDFIIEVFIHFSTLKLQALSPHSCLRDW